MSHHVALRVPLVADVVAFVCVSSQRYTAWFKFNGTGARGPFRTGTGPDFFGRVMVDESLGRELYDHGGDSFKRYDADWPGGNTNLVDYPEHAALVKGLHQRLLEYIQLK